MSLRRVLPWYPLPVALVLVTSACATTTRNPPGVESQTVAEARLASFVLSSRDVIMYNSLEEAFRGRVPSARVVSTSDCPRITLRRGQIPGPWSSPLVYVDGTRTSGTCVLRDIFPRDVERVEVYPLGVTLRPGYAMNSGGLILVFMKDGRSIP